MADASAPIESQSSPVTLVPPRSLTTERTLLKDFVLPALVGASLAVATLGSRHFLTPNELPRQNITVQVSEPVASNAHQNTFSFEVKPFGDIEQRAKDVIREGGWIKNLVNDKRLNIPEDDKDFWFKRLLGMIAIESDSEIHASSGKAFGFTQLTKAATDDIISEYKIPGFNIFNPWENTFVGLAHQLKLADRYGKDLSLWAHHLGSGNMDQLLLAYLKPLVSEDDSIMDKKRGITSNTQLKRYIEHYRITTEDLLTWPNLDEVLDSLDANHDETKEYWKRYQTAIKAITQSLGTKA